MPSRSEMDWSSVRRWSGVCIIETTYDTAGRQTVRNASDLGSGSNLDGSVRRVEIAYTTRGQPNTVTQYDATTAGNVADQVQSTYDDWGNMTKFEQDVDSPIGASGRAAFRRVAWIALIWVPLLERCSERSSSADVLGGCVTSGCRRFPRLVF